MIDMEDYLKQIDDIILSGGGSQKTIQLMGLGLQLNPGIWDPTRGKTSQMMIDILADYPINKVTRALDVGTGSGILALILKQRGIISVDAIDLSNSCVVNAALNAKKNNLELNIFRSDLFSATEHRYDLVLFNSPATHPLRRGRREELAGLWSNEENVLERFAQEWLKYKTPNGRALVTYSEFEDYSPLQAPILKTVKKRLLTSSRGAGSESGILELY